MTHSCVNELWCGSKSLSEPILAYCWARGNGTSNLINCTPTHKNFNFNQYTYMLFQENAFVKVVCKMAGFFMFQCQWVKGKLLWRLVNNSWLNLSLTMVSHVRLYMTQLGPVNSKSNIWSSCMSLYLLRKSDTVYRNELVAENKMYIPC